MGVRGPAGLKKTGCLRDEAERVFTRTSAMKHAPSKVGRNDPCPCGSGLKYKKCCWDKTPKPSSISQSLEKRYARTYGIRLKKDADIAGIRKAGRLALKTLDLVEAAIRPGLVTDEINRLVHEVTVENGAVPAPLHYRGFPKSVCVSVNEVICHGIPGERGAQGGRYRQRGCHAHPRRLLRRCQQNLLRGAAGTRRSKNRQGCRRMSS